MCSRQNSGHAFTLLEVLVALLIVSVLVAAVYSSLTLAMAAREKAEQAIKPARAAELALERMRVDLSSALPPVGLLAGEFVGEVDSQTGVGQGESHAIRFHAKTGAVGHIAAADYDREPDAPTDDIQMIEWEFVQSSSDEPGTLVRRVTSNLLASTAAEPQEQVLCRNVRSLVFRYYDGTDWIESWDSAQYEDSLPIAVEATMEMVEPTTSDPVRAAATRAGAVSVAGTAVPGEGTVSYTTRRVMLLPCTKLTPQLQTGLTF
jgi:general secretion pathway protein J